MDFNMEELACYFQKRFDRINAMPPANSIDKLVEQVEALDEVFAELNKLPVDVRNNLVDILCI